jgi:hypothetical protein
MLHWKGPCCCRCAHAHLPAPPVSRPLCRIRPRHDRPGARMPRAEAQAGRGRLCSPWRHLRKGPRQPTHRASLALFRLRGRCTTPCSCTTGPCPCVAAPNKLPLTPPARPPRPIPAAPKALSWTLYHVLQRPDVEAALLAEAERVLGPADPASSSAGAQEGGGGEGSCAGCARPSYDQIHALKYGGWGLKGAKGEAKCTVFEGGVQGIKGHMGGEGTCLLRLESRGRAGQRGRHQRGVPWSPCARTALPHNGHRVRLSPHSRSARRVQ